MKSGIVRISQFDRHLCQIRRHSADVAEDVFILTDFRSQAMFFTHVLALHVREA